MIDARSTDRYLPPPAAAANLHSLRVFAAVAAAGSITGAAARLFRAPSAITRTLAELERVLGATLVERQPRGLLLTAAGEATLVRARRIEREIEATVADLRRFGVADEPSASGLLAMLANGRKLLLVSELATLASISGTAARLGVSQAGASMALARIEATLGVALFRRRSEGMVATDAAERIARLAAAAFAELRHLESDIAELTGRVGGAVIVGTTPLGRSPLFAAAIADAVMHHPGLRVVTVESNYRTLTERLGRGDVDLAVVVLRGEPAASIVTEELFVDELALMVRARHPLLAAGTAPTMATLLSQRWILPRSTVLGRAFIEERFRALGLAPPEPAIETGDPAIVRQLLTGTDMVAATSPHQLAAEIAQGAVVELPLKLPGARRRVGLITRAGALLAPAALVVAAAIRDHARRQRDPG